jgi:fatty acid desaturase
MATQASTNPQSAAPNAAQTPKPVPHHQARRVPAGLADAIRSMRGRHRPPSLAWGLATLASYFILMGLVVALCVSRSPTMFWLVYIPGAVFLGTRLRGLRNIVHECAHFSFVDSPRGNRAVGHFLSILTVSSFAAYRRQHLSHHRFLGDYGRDEDFGRLTTFRFHDPITPGSLLRHILTPFTLIHLPEYISLTLVCPEDGRAVNVLRYCYVVGLCGFAGYFPLAFFLYVAVPFFIVLPSINYWTDCVDHSGILHGADEIDRSRNFIVSAPLRLLFFPRNDHWHLIHHLMPFLAPRQFFVAHAELSRKVPEYAALTHDVAGKMRNLIGQWLPPRSAWRNASPR